MSRNPRLLGGVRCAPWPTNITAAVKAGGNALEIQAANLRPDRPIGDEQEAFQQGFTLRQAAATELLPVNEVRALSSGHVILPSQSLDGGRGPRPGLGIRFRRTQPGLQSRVSTPAGAPGPAWGSGSAALVRVQITDKGLSFPPNFDIYYGEQ
jgi:hypothetical protein